MKQVKTHTKRKSVAAGGAPSEQVAQTPKNEPATVKPAQLPLDGAGALIKFRPYQQPVFLDRTSGILILHWSRQIGKSYTLAAWAVDRLLSQLPKYDTWLVTVLSNSRDNGAEFCLKAAEVCRKLDLIHESEDQSADVTYENMRMEVRVTEVKDLTASKVIDYAAAPKMLKTASAADFNVGLSKSQWDLGFDYHVKFDFSEVETGLAVDSLNTRDYGWVVTAQSSSGPLTLGTGLLTVVKDGGLTVLNPPAIGDPSYVRVDDYDADKKGFIKRVNEKGVSILLFNELGHGIELRATPGSSQPELEIIKHNPPA